MKNIKINNKTYILVFIILGFIFYGNTLFNKYALDDAIVITQNSFTKKGFSGIDDILTNEGFTGFFGKKKDLVAGGRYRPLSLVTFAIEYQFFGLNPFISHLINVLLYILTTVLLFKILSKLLNENINKSLLNISFIASLLFLIHPIHTEVVANIKGRDEIMTLLGALYTLYLSIKYINNKKKIYLLYIFIIFFLALMSKENAITFLAIIPLSIYYFIKDIDYKKDSIILIPLLAATFLYLYIRYKVIGFTFSADSKELMNNPYVNASIMEKFATVFYTMLLYIKLLVFPHPLTFDYYPKQIPIINWSDIRAILSFLFYLFIGVYALISLKKKTIISYSVWFYLITFSVVSNLFFNVGTFMNERFMYISSIGFVLIVAYFIVKFIKNNKLKYGLTIVLILLSAAKTISRNSDWKNDYILFTSDIKTSQNSAKGNTTAGGKSLEMADKLQKILLDKTSDKQILIREINKLDLRNSEKKELIGDNISINEIYKNIDNKIKTLQQNSLSYLEKAVKIHPTYNDALLLLGNVRYRVDKKDVYSVWNAYERILKTTPAFQKVFDNLDIILNDSVPAKTRLDIWLKAYKYNPKDFSTNYNLGHIYGKYFGKNDSAIFYLNRAVQIKKSGKAFKDLGVAYGVSKKYKEALWAFNEAYKLNKSDMQLLQNIAITYMQTAEYKKAAEIFAQILQKEPNSKQALGNYINALIHAKDYQKALDILLPMYEKTPDDFSVNYNLAVIYSQMGDKDKFNFYYSNAKKLNPNLR